MCLTQEALWFCEFTYSLVVDVENIRVLFEHSCGGKNASLKAVVIVGIIRLEQIQVLAMLFGLLNAFRSIMIRKTIYVV